MLLEVPMDGGGRVIVETDEVTAAEGIALASPAPGRPAKAARTLAESLEELQPMLRAIREKLVEAGPQDFTVGFGVKLGGETGVIVAKGTAEVNLSITMTWHHERAAG
jgi:hypothetical protein